MTETTYVKGFDSELSCHGRKFQVGETYRHEGEARDCEGGFRAWEYPLDMLDYYAPAGSRYCTVTLAGAMNSD